MDSTYPRLKSIATSSALRHLPATLLVGTLSAVLYLATLSRDFTGASLEFVSEIETGDWPTMLHRHKLLIHPMGWAFYHLWRLIGWQGRGLLPLQVFNALAGALCVSLLYMLAMRLTGSQPIAFLTAAGFAASAGVWLYSTESEFVTLPLAESMLVLFWLLDAGRDRAGRLGYPVRLGVGTGVAILTFFAGVFLVPAVTLGLWLGGRRQGRLKTILGYLLVVGITVVPVYALMMYVVYGVRDWQSLQHWQLYGGQGTGEFYGKPEPANIGYGLYAAVRTLVTFPGLGLSSSTLAFLEGATLVEKLAFAGFTLASFLLAAIPLVVLFARYRDLLSTNRMTFAVLGLWAALNAVFAAYWVPKDLKFWYPLLVPWWLLVGMLLLAWHRSQEGQRDTGRGPTVLAAAPGIVAAVVGLIFVVNGAGLVLPHHDLSRNREYQIAMSVRQQTRPGDLIISPYPSGYIPYFGERTTIVLLFQFLNDSDSKNKVLADLDKTIKTAHQQGHRVFFADPGAIPPTDISASEQFTLDDFRSYRTSAAWASLGQVFYEVKPQ